MNFLDYMKTLFGKKKAPADELQAAKEDVLAMTSAPTVKAPELPEGVKYDRIEYDAPSDEEIAQTAEKELEAYKNESIAAIERETAAERAGWKRTRRTAARVWSAKSARSTPLTTRRTRRFRTTYCAAGWRGAA